MAYVKLDTGILDSTLWVDRGARDVFLTALLMAMPHEVEEDTPALAIREIAPLGFTVPAGWYGLVSAAGAGIVRRAGMDPEEGLAALERLCQPDPESRTGDFDGRRVVRISGGFLVLNFMRYRERDTTAAERMKRYRERNRASKTTKRSDAVHRNGDGVTNTNVTEAVSSKQEAVSSKQEAGEAAAGAAASEVMDRLTADLPPAQADAVADAYRYYRAIARSPEALDGNLRMMADGAAGPAGRPVPWPVLGRALQEMQVAGSQLTPAAIRAFAKRLLDAVPVTPAAQLGDLPHGSF